MSTKTIELKFPIKTPAGELTAISLRRPKVRDMKRAQQQYPNDQAGAELALIAAITEQALTPEDLEELDLADYGAVQAEFRTLVGAAA